MSYLERVEKYMSKRREGGNSKEETLNLDHILKLKLSELAKRNMAIEIYSEILGCEIWLCSNEEMATQVREDEPGAIIYTTEELQKLIELNPDPEGLRNIHIAKSIFSGSKIIDSKLREEVNEKE
jgi:hypothetical protein